MHHALPAARQRHDHRAEERQARAGILRLGALLGWDAPTVARFAEAVTGRPWRRCGRADLQRILAAYAALGRQLRAAHGQPPRASSSDGRPR